MTETVELDLSNVPDAAVADILKQAETFLAATVTLALAADQRATRLCSMFGSAGVALLAGVMALVSEPPLETELVFSGATTSLLLFVASFLAARAARPIKFHVARYEPRFLIPGAPDPVNLPRHIIKELQRRISMNRAMLDRAGKLATRSMWGGGRVRSKGIRSEASTILATA